MRTVLLSVEAVAVMVIPATVTARAVAVGRCVVPPGPMVGVVAYITATVAVSTPSGPVAVVGTSPLGVGEDVIGGDDKSVALEFRGKGESRVWGRSGVGRVMTVVAMSVRVV